MKYTWLDALRDSLLDLKGSIFDYVRDIKWDILYRVHPNYKFNKVDLKLPYKYHEIDTRMIQAIRVLFYQYMEVELPVIQSCMSEPRDSELDELYRESKELDLSFKNYQWDSDPHSSIFDELQSRELELMVKILSKCRRMWT